VLIAGVPIPGPLPPTRNEQPGRDRDRAAFGQRLYLGALAGTIVQGVRLT
jgi:hypothetical protein